MKKRLFSLALASVMALSLAGCGGSKEAATEAETKAETEQTAADTSAKAEDTTAQEETKAESEAASEAVSESAGGTLIVGFDQDFPPMGFMGDNGEYTGFDLELAKEVAERLGLEYTGGSWGLVKPIIKVKESAKVYNRKKQESFNNYGCSFWSSFIF